MTFEIKCKVCGSLNCVVEPLIDYDWYETPLEDGFIIRCEECDNEERM